MTPLSEADAARVLAIHKERDAIWRSDRGCGLNAAEEFKLSKLDRELKEIRDRQYGVISQVPAPLPPLRKKRRPLPRSVSRNLCKCDLERFKDELSPGVVLPGGQLSGNTATASPPRMPRAKSVRELCPRCHLPKVFEEAQRWGRSLAEVIRRRHWFEVDARDLAWLEARLAEWQRKAAQ